MVVKLLIDPGSDGLGIDLVVFPRQIKQQVARKLNSLHSKAVAIRNLLNSRIDPQHSEHHVANEQRLLTEHVLANVRQEKVGEDF